MLLFVIYRNLNNNTTLWSLSTSDVHDKPPDVYIDFLIVLFYHLPLHSCCQGQSASGRPSSLWWIFVLCLLYSLKESFFWDFLSLVKDCLPPSPPQCWDYRAPGDSTLAFESACNCHLDNKLFPTFLFPSFQRSKKSFIWKKESMWSFIFL